MDLSEIVKILIKHSNEVKAEMFEFYKALGENDEKEAWKHLVVCLHKAGVGLRVCNGHLPDIQKKLEERGIKVKSPSGVIGDEIIISDDMQQEFVPGNSETVKLRVKPPIKLIAIPKFLVIN